MPYVSTLASVEFVRLIIPKTANQNIVIQRNCRIDQSIIIVIHNYNKLDHKYKTLKSTSKRN